MYNNKLLFFYSRFVVQPPQNIQDEGSYVFKGKVPKLLVNDECLLMQEVLITI